MGLIKLSALDRRTKHHGPGGAWVHQQLAGEEHISCEVESWYKMDLSFIENYPGKKVTSAIALPSTGPWCPAALCISALHRVP